MTTARASHTHLQLIGEWFLFSALVVTLMALIYTGISGLDHPLGVVRLLLSIFFLFFAPGYSFVAIIFPRSDSLDGIERFALSIGISIAIIPLGILAIDELMIPLNLNNILLLHLGILSLFGIVAGWVRWRIPAKERFTPTLPWRGRKKYQTPVLIASIVIIASFVVMMIAAVSIFTFPSPKQNLTAFYILGSEGFAEDFPRIATATEEVRLTIGITNQELIAVTYQVFAEDNTGIIGQSEKFALSPGETTEQTLNFIPQQVGDSVPIRFSLYREDQENPYRDLQLYMQVEEPIR